MDVFIFNWLSLPTLQIIWFVLMGILWTGYAVLDGFDLGVGALHLFTKTDEERRTMLNSIGPVWDGNEVWLVVGGGALFAAFPNAYATVFSAFYLPFILLLVMLIFRAIAIEFRSKEKSAAWRTTWDIVFAVGSIGSALLLGITLGNIIQGIPLNGDGEFTGTFWMLLNPYAMLVGLTTLALFMMHANIYVALKTEGMLQEKITRWVPHTTALFCVLYVATTMFTLVYMPHMIDGIRAQPLLVTLAVLNILTLANVPRSIYAKRYGQAFVSSCLNIILLLSLFGLGVFPNIVMSVPHPELSLTLYNASSSAKTLGILLLIAVLGIPLVLAYTTTVYWIFRGKVRLEPHSY